MSHKQRNNPLDQLPDKQVEDMTDNELMAEFHLGLHRFYIWLDLREQENNKRQIAVLNRKVIKMCAYQDRLKNELIRRECDPSEKALEQLLQFTKN